MFFISITCRRADVPQYGRLIPTKPYRHPAVKAVLGHCFFKGTNSIAERIQALFPRNKDTGALQIPQPMLALACTAVRHVLSHNVIPDEPLTHSKIWSALSDLATGTLQRTNFESARVTDNYETHLTILNKIAKERPMQYTELMETLFIDASYVHLPTMLC